ncbi:MAG: CHASE4 domain-containing protein [Thiotrichales bacterium]
MSLRAKVISLLLVLFGLYASVGYVVQQQVVYPSFVELEHEEAQKNVARAVEAVQRELELLQPSVATWAYWDDTYRFMADRNRGYIESNLNREALESLQVQLLAFYDLDGQRTWGMSVDLDTLSELDPDTFLPATLSEAHPLLTEQSGHERKSGILNLPAGPMLFVSYPILTTERSGPSRGNVVMGRLLNNNSVSRIASQTRINLHVRRAVETAVTIEATQPSTDLALSRTPIQITQTPAAQRGETTLTDLHGQPGITLIVDTPREITAQGANALRFASLSTALAGTLALVLMLVLLRRTVFEPVARLTAHATALGAHDDLNGRLNLNRSDEIGTLAREFDRMVDRLAETRQRLLEQSYQSGVAEMASGVLHNIGNAVTPLGVKLATLQQDLRYAPVEDMALARAELADPTTPLERRDDLEQFLNLAADEVSDLVRRTAQALETVQSQVDHVQSILIDQQRFSRAERVLESLLIDQVVTETVRLMPENLRTVVTVEIGPSLANLTPVRASRVALQQVINNLLINAAESIRESGQSAATGRIRIEARTDPETATVHLCFEDNGVGIAPEHLTHLFERGFSTKARGSGMGLHWSANTISAMGGRLLAESAGAGLGARLRLHLPIANDNQESLGKAA